MSFFQPKLDLFWKFFPSGAQKIQTVLQLHDSLDYFGIIFITNEIVPKVIKNNDVDTWVLLIRSIEIMNIDVNKAFMDTKKHINDYKKESLKCCLKPWQV